MTNEEVIELLMELRICKDDCSVCRLRHLDGDTHCHHEKALNLAIKALEQTEWIPVSERLPKAGEYIGDVAKYYLVQNEYGDMLVARYTHSEYWEQMYQLKPIEDKIVAWMSLPKPYKAESEVEE